MPKPTGTPRRTYGPCAVYGCDRLAIVKADPMCGAHYAVSRQTARATEVCRVLGCGRMATFLREKLCGAHHKRFRKGSGSTRAVQLTTAEILRRDDQGRKVCSICRGWHPTDEYTVNRSRPDGLSAWCRSCTHEKWLEYHPVRRQSRFRRYGITSEHFDALLAQQDFRCVGCNSDDPGESGWHIDHDHSCCPTDRSCGKCVRGILCRPCNNALGMVRDDPRVLQNLAQYLLTWEATSPRRD